MANKVLHLEELYEREIADLARDEALLKEAFELFRQASGNPVLSEVLERVRLEATDLGEKLAGLAAYRTRETRRDAVRGIIEEGQRRIKEIGDHHLVDAELICTAQRLLGYQAAGYRSVLPLTRMLNQGEATLLCETAIETKQNAVDRLQETALHQVHWRASWWAPEHMGAWQKVKKVFREDWEKTKEHLGVSSEDDAETARRVDFDAGEPAFRYGYGAALHYRDHHWNEDTVGLLRSGYGGLWDQDTRPKVEAGWRYARKQHVAPVS